LPPPTRSPKRSKLLCVPKMQARHKGVVIAEGEVDEIETRATAAMEERNIPDCEIHEWVEERQEWSFNYNLWNSALRGSG
jgi:hypothetical protein